MVSFQALANDAARAVLRGDDVPRADGQRATRARPPTIWFQRQTTLVPIGIAADAIAKMEGFTRAVRRLCARVLLPSPLAMKVAGLVVPVKGEGGEVVLAQDETLRASTTPQSLSDLTPAFAEMGVKYGVDALLCKQYGLAGIDHVQHAGNSPTMADGAAAVLVASEGAVARLGPRHVRAFWPLPMRPSTMCWP